MTTTYTDFVNAVAGIVLPSVSADSRLTTPPMALNTAGLPCSWPMLPTGDAVAVSFCGGVWTTFVVDWITAVEPVGQSRIDENYPDTIAIMDEIQTALCALTPKTIGEGKLEWTIRVGIQLVGDINYWAVITTITGYG